MGLSANGLSGHRTAKSNKQEERSVTNTERIRADSGIVESNDINFGAGIRDARGGGTTSIR